MMEHKILVVEDSQVAQKVLCYLLNQKPLFTPVLCTCFQEAELTLNENQHTFFAAIVDLNLPDAKNGEIVDLVLSKNIPCIVLTGNFDDSLRLKLLNKGVLDYITKDSRYSFDHVMKVVERLRKNQNIKVLVADDSSTSRLFIKLLLEQYRFQVIEVVNGREALEKLEEDTEIRMLITDYNMPLVNGYELVRMLRYDKRYQNLVIIGLSSEGDCTLSAKFIKAGANDFLKKPFYHEEFNCRVERTLEAQEMLETIRRLANIDSLTKLYNRRYLFDEGSTYFEKALAEKSTASLAMLDLDNFKSINDTYGHITGDAILKALGREIKSIFSDVLPCRFGGEEFCIVADCDPERFSENLLYFIDKIRSSVFTEANIAVTFSIGVCRSKANSLEEAVRIADDLLYKAKKLGRNRIEFD